MKSLRLCALAATIVAAACSTPEGEDVEGAGSAINGTTTIGGITLEKKTFSAKVKAKEPPDEFHPDFDSCEVNVEYYQITGTAHDETINKILRGDWREPTAESCEYAETYDAHAILRGIDPEQGLLSIVEPESSYEGGAHPNYYLDFKNIDLRSGKLLTLGDYVKADASPKLNEMLNQEIATQRVRVEVDPPKVDRGGKPKRFEIRRMSEEEQEMLRNYAQSYFLDYNANGGPGAPKDTSKLTDFVISGTGIRINLVNTLPHAMAGSEAAYKLNFRELEEAGVLRQDTDLIARTRAARPRRAQAE
jgi:hypothetical protein